VREEDKELRKWKAKKRRKTKNEKCERKTHSRKTRRKAGGSGGEKRTII
jgi:hypothetical protein